MPADGERVAVNEQAIRDLRDDVQGFERTLARFGARLGTVEGDMTTLLAERREERRLAKQRQDSIQTWLRLLTLAVGFGGLCMSAAIFVAGFYFHH